MNILVLMAGEKRVLSTDNYPISLIEIDGTPLIERLVHQCKSVTDAKLFFAIPAQDIRRYRLDQVVRLLDESAQVIVVEGSTEGAACTALLACTYIDNEEPLLILNADELMNISYQKVIDNFQQRDLDGGTVVFHSIHPRYSFVLVDGRGFVVEAAEKDPISNQATAGFYYFKRGVDFIDAAKNIIRKDARQNGAFYVCPSFNELILKGKSIGVFEISLKDFHPLKTDRQVQQYSVSEQEVR